MSRGIGTVMGVSSTDLIISGYSGWTPQRSYWQWIYFDSTVGNATTVRLFQHADDGVTAGCRLAVFPNVPQYDFQAVFSTTNGDWNTTGGDWLNDQNWNQIGVSFDDSNVNNKPILYANDVKKTVQNVSGQLFEISTPAGTAVSGAGNKICIGNRNAGDRTLAGLHAHFAHWNCILSDAEFHALYCGALPTTIRPQSLVVYHPLDGYIHPVFDRSIYRRHGTLVGTKLGTSPPLISPSPWVSIKDEPGIFSKPGITIISATGVAGGVGNQQAFTFYFQSTASILTPDADNIDGTWTNESGGTTLTPSIDESVPSDADYIQSAQNPSSDVCKISLSDPSGSIQQPLSVFYRYYKTGTGTCNLQVRLLEGTTQIASWSHSNISATPTTVEQVLTSPQFSSIGNPNNLFLEFTATSP